MSEFYKSIRIVIPAFKAGNTLLKCVESILVAIKFHRAWEIVIVDNGQNTDLTNLFEGYPVTILQRDKYQSAAYARNEGARGFNNGLLVFVDSDVICERNCIEILIKPLQYSLCNATIGNYSKNTRGLSFSQKFKQLYINYIYGRDGSVIKNDFWTAICAIDAKVFHKMKGFNADFLGANGEDQEFGIRMTKNGFRVLSVKSANGQHLNPYGVINIVRNDFKKGLTAVRNSLESKVPLSDNRHSKLADILSVFFAILTNTLLALASFYPNLLPAVGLTFILWFLCRMSLSIAFFKSGGVFFFLKSLILMYCLDLVRFTCVVIGIVRNKILKVPAKAEPEIISIPAEV